MWTFVFIMLLITSSVVMKLTIVNSVIKEHKKIFAFVQSELKGLDTYKGVDFSKMSEPAVRYVPREKLIEIFMAINEVVYDRMVKEYGQARVDEMVEMYKKEVIGITDSNDVSEIFIFKDLEPCERKAIVAHEYTHFLQVKILGKIKLDDKDKDNKHTYREMQGGQIQTLYEERFCKDEEAG
ncbi:MAG TPA: hypothetical protein ENH82_13915 [bacterium]|nr:hypothetical protein [bacterium]